MPKIAVLLPCYNESLTIEKVVKDFRAQLPDADIWVYDNNSTDGSGDLARAAGAKVRHVRQQGKGHVVRRMFQEVEADVYVMVDADDTYPADEVQKLIQPIVDGEADMVNGDRLSSTYMTENKRPGHNFGNTLVCTLIRVLWGQRVHDVMTGYRAFSRLFVKSCPVLANGFEIETEMTLHTIDKRMSLVEVPVQYRDRPAGSYSKLNTVSDGFRVLFTIFNLFRFYRPELFFGTVGLVLLLIAAGLFLPVLVDYFQTGLVPRVPTQIFSGFVAIAGLLSFGVGLILGACKKQSDQMFEIIVSQERGRETLRS
ncbi:MAG TPA: glycosyltransferase [Candidatus Spyradenecus faecavium]|uniref:Glycosyltransferase n=1 Tax=Candidatus Spyradenecus faecavium TaxID=2840947 RepID=A0A9D1T2Y9_9BACT|nr:glycosyltransferase [Candidatus Spyradenecus faecavium]